MPSFVANMQLVTLRYAARVEHVKTEEVVTDPDQLRQLHGVSETALGLSELAPESGLAELDVRRAPASLQFDDERRQLTLTVAFELAPPTPAQATERLVAYCRERFGGPWGCNWDFELPQAFADYAVHVDDSPIDPSPHDCTNGLMAHWGEWSFDTLAELSDAQLEQLIADLRPYGDDLGRGHTSKQARQLLRDAQSHAQRRAAERNVFPVVPFEDLDKLDELPADMF